MHWGSVQLVLASRTGKWVGRSWQGDPGSEGSVEELDQECGHHLQDLQSFLMWHSGKEGS